MSGKIHEPSDECCYEETRSVAVVLPQCECDTPTFALATEYDGGTEDCARESIAKDVAELETEREEKEGCPEDH